MRGSGGVRVPPEDGVGDDCRARQRQDRERHTGPDRAARQEGQDESEHEVRGVLQEERRRERDAQRQRVAERSDQGDVPRHDHQDRRQPDPPLDDAEDGEHGNGYEREGEPPAEHGRA